MSEEDLERYESDVELQIYREYRDVLPMFRFVIETEPRFYLANRPGLNTPHATRPGRPPEPPPPPGASSPASFASTASLRPSRSRRGSARILPTRSPRRSAAACE